jgi:5'(3')-deoxyribonucleotidase
VIILCDLDGVLADFVTGSIEACQLPIKHDDVDCWNYFEPYMTRKEFWQRIHEQKYFWEDLPVYPWAHDLVGMLAEYGDVVFCTDPSGDDEGATGKIKWLKRHGFVLPSGTNYVLTNYKWMLAGRDRVLVDDYQKNCAMFDKHDGMSVVFPQRWNGVGIGEDRVRYVEDFLKLL